MATGDVETNDLIARAHKACTRAANVADQLKTTIERAQGTSAKTRGEELAHSRLVELNELVENLNKRLESQPTIEQAKGILMARSHCGPDEAFEMLRRASMRMNRKLRDVARDIVEATGARNGSHQTP